MMEAHDHIVHPGTYILIFISLLILTAVTTAVGFVDLGELNTVVALAIAVCKAALVLLFFMHLRWSHSLNRLVMVAGLFWLALLIGLTLTDTMTRHWDPTPKGWVTAPSAAIQKP